MGRFDKVEEYEEEEDIKEPDLIDDPNELNLAYKQIITRAKMSHENMMNYVIPLYSKLKGAKKNEGDYEVMREMYSNIPWFLTTDIGKFAAEIIGKSSDLVEQLRAHSQQMYNYIYHETGLKYILESSLSMIDNLYDELDKKEAEINKLKEQPEKSETTPLKQEIIEHHKPGESELKYLNIVLNQKWKKYEEYVRSGNKKFAISYKGQMMQLAKGNPYKREYIYNYFMSNNDKLMNELGKSFFYEKERTGTPNQSLKKPPQNPLSLPPKGEKDEKLQTEIKTFKRDVNNHLDHDEKDNNKVHEKD